ncbi:MAG: dioxygenase [Gammaproteobacteria bacterium]|nr:dioxygenase [Gammaproteobacteria bacterium]
MNAIPTLFVSHGSPLLALEDGPARRFLGELGKQLPRPSAILAVSAHWQDRRPTVSFADQPETIHDFGGFPDALYQLHYPVPGAPALAEETANLLEKAGFEVGHNLSRGLDHGAWAPLRLMYPAGEIPVTQLALLHGAGPREHYELGAALRPLHAQGVLIVGSGSMTHNLYRLMGNDGAESAPRWVSEFAEWIAARLRTGDIEALLDYRRQAPHAADNHPTEEHLLPLFVALGAAGEDAIARRLHASYTYGVLAMDAYAFDGSDEETVV